VHTAWHRRVRGSGGSTRACPAAAPVRVQANELLSIKPTMAKKLSDRIKTLEEQLTELRSDKKVGELEGKLQVRRGGGGGAASHARASSHRLRSCDAAGVGTHAAWWCMALHACMGAAPYAL
jgi:hypothetical protein